LKDNVEAADIVLTDGETNKVAGLNRNYRFFSKRKRVNGEALDGIAPL